jgi:hypothetical protein
MANNPSYLSKNGNFNLGNAQLAEGTNAGTIKTTAATDFNINGYTYTKAATDNITVTAGAAQADLTTCLYLVTIETDGDVVVTKGTEQITGSGKDLLWPAIPDNSAVLGAIKVVTSGATFTAGTTDLGAGTVTDTYYNFFTPPTFVLQA